MFLSAKFFSAKFFSAKFFSAEYFSAKYLSAKYLSAAPCAIFSALSPRLLPRHCGQNAILRSRRVFPPTVIKSIRIIRCEIS